MNVKRLVLLAGIALLALPATNAQAHVGIGVSIGLPLYYRPYCYGPYYPYYYYQPVVPVYVAPPPVVVQAAPVVEAVPVQPVPAVQSAPQTVQPASRVESRLDEIDRLTQHLSNPDDKVRADVVIQLGRLRARRAAEPLERVLAADRSPDVRDAAARALGLIGMPASLPALERAAQADADGTVRSSARFAGHAATRKSAFAQGSAIVCRSSATASSRPAIDSLWWFALTWMRNTPA
jgi:hypothetical protein